MSVRYDSIVIGGGHNGLVCAAYLARGGQNVLVVEAAERLGGAAVTREFVPGFRVSAGAHVLHMLPAGIFAELELARHGLMLPAQRMPTTAMGPAGEGVGISDAGVSGVSAEDSAAYQRFMLRMRRF